MVAAPAVPPPAGAPPAGEEEGGGQKTKTLTDMGYVTVIRLAQELLSINPEDLDENDLDIFAKKVTPKNAMDLQGELEDLVTRYGSPGA